MSKANEGAKEAMVAAAFVECRKAMTEAEKYKMICNKLQNEMLDFGKGVKAEYAKRDAETHSLKLQLQKAEARLANNAGSAAASSHAEERESPIDELGMGSFSEQIEAMKAALMGPTAKEVAVLQKKQPKKEKKPSQKSSSGSDSDNSSSDSSSNGTSGSSSSDSSGSSNESRRRGRSPMRGRSATRGRSESRSGRRGRSSSRGAAKAEERFTPEEVVYVLAICAFIWKVEDENPDLSLEIPVDRGIFADMLTTKGRKAFIDEDIYSCRKLNKVDYSNRLGKVEGTVFVDTLGKDRQGFMKRAAETMLKKHPNILQSFSTDLVPIVSHWILSFSVGEARNYLRK
jgi:hypothetical protein